jgi:hypothetical protein
MPYIPNLAPCGQEIAGYLGLTTVWASIEISHKDPPGRLQELLTKWLDGSEQETSPHSWEFFVDVVRKVGKGKLLSSSVDHTTSVSLTSSSPQSHLTNRPSKELRVQHLMPYIPNLAPCGQEIAGYLGLTTAWASIEISG